MPLSFPNPSRNYESDRHRVRFWGHDSAMEISFVLEENALFLIDPRTKNSERALLDTFDVAIDQIHAAARKAYAFKKRIFHVLTASDFK